MTPEEEKVIREADDLVPMVVLDSAGGIYQAVKEYRASRGRVFPTWAEYGQYLIWVAANPIVDRDPGDEDKDA